MKKYTPLNRKEKRAFEDALISIGQNAEEHCQLRPAMTTFLEEVAEAILAARGKHEDALHVEITQIGGIAINILWQLYMDYNDHICDIGE